jgi:uncharacterized protein YcbX
LVGSSTNVDHAATYEAFYASAMRVVALWRYPVKSMQGEQLDVADVRTAGIVADRQWAVVDNTTGLALTARRCPDLLFAAARLTDGGVAIELPSGEIATDDAALSAWLGRDVTLQAAGKSGTYEIASDFEDEAGSEWMQWTGPAWSFHDSGRTHVSILSTGSIGSWDWRRFRGNVIVEADDRAENVLVGSTVTAGTTRLDVGKQIDRCVMTTRPQPGGIERDLDVLRTINAERATFLGVGATVAKPGTIRLGDELA